jgi:hypothetical protein
MKGQDNTERPPDGFVLVDVVLTTHQAFIVRKWEAVALRKIEAIRARAEETKTSFYARNEVTDFRPGVRCEIVSVHHPCFAKDVGKIIVVTKVSADTRQLWAHDDKPVTYKVNRQGRRVVDSDPRCIQTVYGMDSLRVLE